MKANGLNFYFEIHGQGEPLILLNGIFSTTSGWSSQLPVLTPHFQVYLYDCRDQGKTELPRTDYPFNTHLDDLHALMNGWGVEKAHFLGISHGTTLALPFAYRYPEKVGKMALLSPLSEWDAQTFDTASMVNHFLNTLSLKDFFPYLMLFGLGSQFYNRIHAKIPELALEFEKRFPNPDSPRRIVRAAYNGQNFPREKLSAILHQTLILTGAEDRYISFAAQKLVHQGLKNSIHKIISETGHSLTLEAPDIINPLILEFLKS